MAHKMDFERLSLIAQGHAAFKLLWCGVRFGIFDIISGKKGITPQSLKEKSKLEQGPFKILIRGLLALGLIERDSRGRLFNADIVEKLLVSSSPTCMARVLGWQNFIVYPGLEHLEESLRNNCNEGLKAFKGTGDTIYQRLSHHPELEKIFHDAMSDLSKSANEYLLVHADLKSINHLVDAGGGDATNAVAIAKKYPHMKLTVFDRKSVLKLAAENIKREGLEQRIFTHEGDFFKDSFPHGIDAILFAHILTIWSLEQNTVLLKRAYDALPLGGKVLIFNMMTNDDETGPLSAALGSPYFLAIATGEGMLYTWNEYESCLKKAGFDHFKRVELPMDHGLIVATK